MIAPGSGLAVLIAALVVAASLIGAAYIIAGEGAPFGVWVAAIGGGSCLLRAVRP